MVIIVPVERAGAALELLKSRGEQASIIGEVRNGTRGVVISE
jgi:hydrogenase maturation factor